VATDNVAARAEGEDEGEGKVSPPRERERGGDKHNARGPVRNVAASKCGRTRQWGIVVWWLEWRRVKHGESSVICRLKVPTNVIGKEGRLATR
jgi:hypothetical protein